MRTEEIADFLRTIEEECRFTSGYTGLVSFRPAVMRAMEQVERREFVPMAYKPTAYADSPLPIGHGQTISQPFIVALMTDLLRPKKDNVILEVGAGSGYQAAILSLLVARVYSIEIIPALAGVASARLRRLGYDNIEIRCGDGYQGWPEHAPFDGIMVTAAAPHVPLPLVQQLKPEGRIVIPVGLPGMPQQLLVIEKNREGGFSSRDVLPVSFVPLTGDHNESL